VVEPAALLRDFVALQEQVMASVGRPDSFELI
jgi:hypothetical protein